MKVVIQRCKKSKVIIDQNVFSEIGFGMNLLVCMENNDNDQTIDKALMKIIKLRIFPDESGNMNKSITDIKGEILAISQFTLSWDGKKAIVLALIIQCPPMKLNLYLVNLSIN